jgi:hypothetical protein
MIPSDGVTDSTAASFELDARHFNPELVKQLISIYRIMFPHEDISDEFYEYVVRKLDDSAAQNEDLPLLLSEGVEALNRQADSASSSLLKATRLEALKRAEKTPFFQTLRSNFVTYFYSNPAIWPRFGYEGTSNDQGGYLYRGFNDIDWIKREEL